MAYLCHFKTKKKKKSHPGSSRNNHNDEIREEIEWVSIKYEHLLTDICIIAALSYISKF